MITFLSLLVGLAPPPAAPLAFAADTGAGPVLAGGPPGATSGSAPDTSTERAALRTAGRHPPPTARWARLAPASADLDTRARRRDDRWFGEDKLKHFFMSFAATSLAYGSVRSLGLDGAPGLAAAGGAVVALGLGKEWRDRREGGPFSVRDLAWDAAGIAGALVIASQTR